MSLQASLSCCAKKKKNTPEATEKHKRQRAAKAELTAQYEKKDGVVLESH